MLRVRLQSPNVAPLEFASTQFEGIGPALVTADGHLVAVQRTGIWERPGKVFASMTFLDEVEVTFSNPPLGLTEVFTPLKECQVIDSSVWHKKDRPELIARFDESLGMWHLLAAPSGPMSHWTIRPAG